MIHFTAAFASFAVTVAAIAFLRPIAFRIDLVDRPGGRKTHHGNVPIIGGLGMFIGIVVGIGLLPAPSPMAGPVLAAFSLMVVVGALDDRFALSPWARLPIQAAAAAIMVYGTDTTVVTLGNPLGLGEIRLDGFSGDLVAILLMVAAINAFNMLDGMDGLAGMAAAIGFAALGYVAAEAGLYTSPRIASIVIAAVVAFLIFNAPLISNNRIRCFMGDAGSTFLGLGLAWLCLRVSQGAGANSVSPTTTLWLVALPMYELIWTFGRRLAKGKSPFHPDAEHFHHKLVRAGFSVRAAFLIFGLLAAILVFLGIAAERLNIPEYLSLLLLVLVGATVVLSMLRADYLINWVPSCLRRAPGNTNAGTTSEPAQTTPRVVYALRRPVLARHSRTIKVEGTIQEPALNSQHSQEIVDRHFGT